MNKYIVIISDNTKLDKKLRLILGSHLICQAFNRTYDSSCT